MSLYNNYIKENADRLFQRGDYYNQLTYVFLKTKDNKWVYIQNDELNAEIDRMGDEEEISDKELRDDYGFDIETYPVELHHEIAKSPKFLLSYINKKFGTNYDEKSFETTVLARYRKNLDSHEDVASAYKRLINDGEEDNSFLQYINGIIAFWMPDNLRYMNEEDYGHYLPFTTEAPTNDDVLDCINFCIKNESEVFENNIEAIDLTDIVLTGDSDDMYNIINFNPYKKDLLEILNNKGDFKNYYYSKYESDVIKTENFINFVDEFENISDNSINNNILDQYSKELEDYNNMIDNYRMKLQELGHLGNEQEIKKYNIEIENLQHKIKEIYQKAGVEPPKMEEPDTNKNMGSDHKINALKRDNPQYRDAYRKVYQESVKKSYNKYMKK